MNLKERLKFLRLERGLTQAQLAKELKIGQTTIAAYENGTHDPQIYILAAYADFFQCSLDYLTGRESEWGEPFIPSERIYSNEERGLLNAYRGMNGTYRKILCEIAETLKNAQNEKEKTKT